jgi:hypothetical protein
LGTYSKKKMRGMEEERGLYLVILENILIGMNGKGMDTPKPRSMDGEGKKEELQEEEGGRKRERVERKVDWLSAGIRIIKQAINGAGMCYFSPSLPLILRAL